MIPDSIEEFREKIQPFHPRSMTRSAIFLLLCLCLTALHATSAADGDHPALAKLEIQQESYLVAEFVLDEPWLFPQRMSAVDDSIERWKTLVLIGQSDVTHMLTNAQIRELHDGPDIPDELIEAQKARMKDRFAESNVKLKVNRVYLVIHEEEATAHLVVPIHWDGGTFYTSFRRVSGTWKTAMGAAAPDKTASLAKELVDAHATKDDHQQSRHPVMALENITTQYADPLIRPKQP